MTGTDIRAACETTIAQLLLPPIKLKRKRVRATDPTISYRLVGSDFDVGVCVVLRRRLRPSEIPQLVSGFTQDACEYRMVFTDYVSARAAEKLKEAGIWFADAQGNASMNLPGKLLLHVAGNRPQATPPPKGQHYSAAGAKVLHYLLKHGPDVHATYRGMREAIGVSIDKIGKLIRELEQAELLQVLGRGDYRVVDAAATLRLWVDAYEAKLAPALLLGRYALAVEYDREFLIGEAQSALEDKVVVGGEVAADALTGHLRPGLLRLYVPEEHVTRVRKKLLLAPSDRGSIELCNLYSREIVGEPASSETATTDPVFVYAELMADGDSRLAETAARLRQERLAWTLPNS